MKSKVMNAIVYPDSTEYDCNQIFKILPNLGCEWFAALHDKDVKPDGTPKKPHYHIIMRFEGTKDFSVVARDLGLTENDIEKSKSFKYGVRYLIHMDSPEKARYDKSVIFGSGQPEPYLVSNNDQKGILLMDAIYSGQVYSIHQLYSLAKELDAWSEFRRGFSMYNTVLHELRSAAVADSSSRRSDREYEERRALQAEIAAQREEIAWSKRQAPFDELPQEVIPEFGETTNDITPQGLV